ncbi:hypothetical protein ABIC08_008272 [Bradyrhizobium sp. RT9b]
MTVRPANIFWFRGVRSGQYDSSVAFGQSRILLV